MEEHVGEMYGKPGRPDGSSRRLMVIVCLVILLIGVVNTLVSCKDGRRFKDTKRVAAMKEDSASYYRDLWGTEHARREVAEADMAVLRVLHGKEIDSVCKRLRIKEKQLRDVSNAVAMAKGRLVMPVHNVQDEPLTMDDEVVGGEPVDTGKQDRKCGGRLFNYRDEYMVLNGYVNDDSAVVEYGVRVPMNVSTYWKRRWFLGRKRTYVNGWSENPNVEIIGLTGIRVK